MWINISKVKLFSIAAIICIIICLGIILVSDSQVEAGSFKDFNHDVKNSNGTLNMTMDYQSLNNDSKLSFKGDNLTINGNGHRIYWAGCEEGFEFNDENNVGIVISNVTISGFSKEAMSFDSKEIIFNNVVFEDNDGEN